MTSEVTYQPVLQGLAPDVEAMFETEPKAAVFVIDADAGEPQEVGDRSELSPAAVELACDWIEFSDGRRVAGPFTVVWPAREEVSLEGAA